MNHDPMKEVPPELLAEFRNAVSAVLDASEILLRPDSTENRDKLERLQKRVAVYRRMVDGCADSSSLSSGEVLTKLIEMAGDDTHPLSQIANDLVSIKSNIQAVVLERGRK